MGRTYTSYLKTEGENCLPWIAVVMISLSLNDKPRAIPDIVLDITEGGKENYNAVYASVWGSVQKLKSMECVIVTYRGKKAHFKPSAYGKRLFSQQLKAYDSSNKLNKLTDCRFF